MNNNNDDSNKVNDDPHPSSAETQQPTDASENSAEWILDRQLLAQRLPLNEEAHSLEEWQAQNVSKRRYEAALDRQIERLRVEAEEIHERISRDHQTLTRLVGYEEGNGGGGGSPDESRGLYVVLLEHRMRALSVKWDRLDQQRLEAKRERERLVSSMAYYVPSMEERWDSKAR